MELPMIWLCVNTGGNNKSNKIAITVSACMGAVVIVALIITWLIIKRLLKKVSIMREIQNGELVYQSFVDTSHLAIMFCNFLRC